MKKIRKISLLLTIVFLGAYANALCSKLLCDVAHLIDQSGIEHTHDFGHDHHHEANVPEDHHTDKGHENEEERDNCCNELALAFFSNQPNHFNQISKTENDYKKIVFPSTSISLKEFSLKHQEQSDLFDDYSPPPPLSDIRVFIQSFLI